MSKQVEIDYTNWRGERSIRKIEPLNMWFGANKFHEGEQWFVEANDVDHPEKGKREFALNKIHSWKSI